MTTNSQLSAEGQQRRNEILTLVLEESHRVHCRRRRRRRLLGAAASMLIVAALVWISWPTAEPRITKRPQASHDGNPSSGVGVDLEHHLVKNEIDDLHPYLVRTREEIPADVLLNDAELLGTLADLGRVEGIIRVHGNTWLTSELDSRLEIWE